MTMPYEVIDSDGHMREDQALFKEKYLPKKWHGSRNNIIPADSFDRSMGGRWGKYGISMEDRIADMKEEGIEISVLYPTMGLNIGHVREPEYAMAVCRAYNDYMGDIYAAHPQFPFVALVAPQNSAGCAAELRRAVTEKGAVGAVLTCHAHGKNLAKPEFYDFYATAEELGVPVSVHPNAYGAEGVSRLDTFPEIHCVGFPVELLIQVTAIMFGGIPERFPKLKMAFLEAGIGWVPYWMDRMDEHWEKRAEEVPLCKKAPSEYMAGGNMFFSFESEDRQVTHTLGSISADNLLYASDYPHWDYSPGSAKEIFERDDLSDEVKRKAFIDNPRRYYKLPG